jgi:signal transduction histidine kinase
VLLGRLRIRGKLALLVVVPLIATLAVTLSNALELSQRANRAQQTADAAGVARLTGALIRELQQERLLSIGLLRQKIGRGEWLVENANVTEKIADIKAGPPLSTELSAALDSVEKLAPVRAAVLRGQVDLAGLFAAYNTAIEALIAAPRLFDAVDGDTTQGRHILALEAVQRGNEGFATVLAALAAVPLPGALAPAAPALSTLQPALARFVTYATPDQLALYQVSTEAVTTRLGGTLGLAALIAGINTIAGSPSFETIEALTELGQFVEVKINKDATVEATRSVEQASQASAGFLGLSFLAMLIVVLLGVAIARSVSRPLIELTRSADRVARLAESELVRVADDEAESPDPVRLQPVDVTGQDEIGDLARVFERVQETAARLVERQVGSRRNVALMFGHVGRRTQNLVGRQVALIDKLENDETEPHRLSELYRLDHISSRLRRNASSLVVLSGATGADEHMSPVGLGDVVRLALAEIEDYSRVDMDVATSIRVVPALINDLVLMMAELMENATAFSPPATRVSVSAITAGESGDVAGRGIGANARLSIVDHGLGMPAERLAEENARLTRRERLDLAPTEVLGLFVVGRLARRHGLVVTLSPTSNGGVTVTIDIPAHLLTAFGPRSMAGPVPAAVSVTSERGRDGRTNLILTDADPALFNVGALNRASETLQSVQPWNAFVAPRPTAAPPPSATPITATPIRPAPAEIEAAPDWTVWPGGTGGNGNGAGPAPSPALAPVAEGVLRQRVPGAQLPAELPGPTNGGADQRGQFRGIHAPVDPASARDLVQAFEDGVRLAESETQAPPVAAPVVSAPPPVPQQRPSPPAELLGRSTSLNRRVPGATLSALEGQARPARTPQRQAHTGQPSTDADQARDSLAQFESGVARALREVSAEQRDDGLPHQDIPHQEGT